MERYLVGHPPHTIWVLCSAPNWVPTILK
uniref:Uncharacterized protein n=1 Tax=Anguilla anguilla TaxID=7936 RepID=A0A0E9SDN9_ANGAN